MPTDGIPELYQDGIALLRRHGVAAGAVVGQYAFGTRDMKWMDMKIVNRAIRQILRMSGKAYGIRPAQHKLAWWFADEVRNLDDAMTVLMREVPSHRLGDLPVVREAFLKDRDVMMVTWALLSE